MKLRGNQVARCQGYKLLTPPWTMHTPCVYVWLQCVYARRMRVWHSSQVPAGATAPAIARPVEHLFARPGATHHMQLCLSGECKHILFQRLAGGQTKYYMGSTTLCTRLRIVCRPVGSYHRLCKSLCTAAAFFSPIPHMPCVKLVASGCCARYCIHRALLCWLPSR